MIKFIRDILIAAIFLFCLLVVADKAFSATNNLEIVWDYPTPPTDLAGFKIYQGDTVLADIKDKAARTVTQLMPALADSETCFTISAYDSRNNESPKSEKYCIDPAPATPGNLRINVNVTVTINQ